LLAKEILISNNKITLPKYGIVSYTNAISEQFFQVIKPDVSASTNGQSLFFEVLVTHATGIIKDDFYKNGDYKSIKINLKDYQFTNKEELENKILNETTNKRIIFWEKEKEMKESSDNNWIIIIFLAILGLIIFIFKLLGLKSNHNKTSSKDDLLRINLINTFVALYSKFIHA